MSLVVSSFVPGMDPGLAHAHHTVPELCSRYGILLFVTLVITLQLGHLKVILTWFLLGHLFYLNIKINSWYMEMIFKLQCLPSSDVHVLWHYFWFVWIPCFSDS